MATTSAANDAERARSVRLTALAVLSTLAVAVVYVIAVRTHLGQRLDDVAFIRRAAVTAATTRRTDRLLGTVSAASLIGVGGALVLVALARRRVAVALAAGIAMGGGVLTTEALKLRILHRPIYNDIGGLAQNSYPSGHATIGMALALGVVMVAPMHLRRLAVLFAAVLATAFGTAVLASGWHRPSDTIGAYFVALAWFCAVSAILAEYERASRRRAPPAQNPAVSRPLLAVAGLALFGLLMFALWKSVATTGLRTVVFAAPYVGACVAIDAVGIIVVGVFYVLQRTSMTRPS